MFLNLEVYKDPYNTCFQNLRILFQFILDEYLKLDQTVRYSTSLLKQVHVEGITRKNKKEMIRVLLLLSGCHLEIPPYLPWHRDVGTLSKLKRLLCQYPLNSIPEKHAISSIYEDLQKANADCITTYKNLRPSEIKKRNLTSSLLVLQKLLRNMKEFVSFNIHQFSQDENVILFLLKKQDEFRRIYGKDFLKKLLPELFLKHPKYKDIEQFLASRYTKRGFYQIAGSIPKHVEKLGI